MTFNFIAHSSPPPPRPSNLQEACWRVLRRNVTLSNVIEMTNWLDQFILPHTEAFHGQCMKYIMYAYVLLRERRGVEELKAKLPADLFERLESEAQERAQMQHAYKVYVGRIIEPRPHCAESCTQQEPAVSGLLSFSYSHPALVVGVIWPPGIDPHAREGYLCTREFEALFGMHFEQFSSLSTWRRVHLKKLHKLF